jgi:hypothetical protein
MEASLIQPDAEFSIQPIVCLCAGYVSHSFRKPELESAGSLPRMSDPLFDRL